jgi:hypothetical protein
MRQSDPNTPESESPTPWDVRFGDNWVRDDSHPHRTVILEHSVPPHEGLLRSEVLTIIGLMRERLSAQTLMEHKLAPVRPYPLLPLPLHTSAPSISQSC